MLIHTKNLTIEADMINNTIVTCDKDSKLNNVKINAQDKNYTYSKMHESITGNDTESLCTFDEGMKITKIIDSIKFKGL